MRLGIFSDVHSNLEALNAVIEDYEDKRIDKFICLGDVVGYGANPNECCDIVKGLASMTVLGNHDAAVAGRMDYSFYYHDAREALNWCVRQLSPENHAWLRSLPYLETMNDMCFSHGSPLKPEKFDYIFNMSQASELIEHYDQIATASFLGHSHLAKSFTLGLGGVSEVVATRFSLRRNRKYIITDGSVGQPRDCDNRACYTVYDTDTRVFEYYRVEYDIESAAKKIFIADLAVGFGKRLFMGV